MSSMQRMGRGLDALFNDAGAKADPLQTATSDSSTSLPLDKIITNPAQPRRHFAKEPLEELAASIRSQGIIQPLLVRPKRGTDLFEIVAGERRWRAAGLANLKEVPVFIRDIADEDVMAAALIENLQREDLNPIEEALALQSLREQCELTQEELASRIGKSRPAIANALRLLQLSMAAQDDLQFGRMHAGHARALLSLSGDEAAQEALRKAIVQQQLNVRDAEGAAQYFKNTNSFPWEGDEAPESSVQASEPVVAPGPRPSNRSKPQAIKDLQKSMTETLAVKASISGTEEKGKITLNYSSADELQRLLSIMGLNN